MVTPYVGVWIETKMYLCLPTQGASLLMWECGLKPRWRSSSPLRTGSLLMWECGLKHCRIPCHRSPLQSLLMWECGLKPYWTRLPFGLSLSLLMWECGLKQRVGLDHPIRHQPVTPYVGVWIETVGWPLRCLPPYVTPYVGVWIETGSYRSTRHGRTRHSLCGSVD